MSDNRRRAASEPTLVGIALDLSGSMKNSLRNDTGGEISRMGSVDQALRRISSELARSTAD
jgi:hypothetical protein